MKVIGDMKYFFVVVVTISLNLRFLVEGTECYSCNSVSTNEECNLNSRSCPDNEPTCLNEIRINSNSKTITKTCKQTEACENQASQNSNNCNGGTINSVCYYCCLGDFCNELEDASEPPTVSTTTTQSSTTTSTEVITTTEATTPTPTTTEVVTNEDTTPTSTTTEVVTNEATTPTPTTTEVVTTEVTTPTPTTTEVVTNEATTPTPTTTEVVTTEVTTPSITELTTSTIETSSSTEPGTTTESSTTTTEPTTTTTTTTESSTTTTTTEASTTTASTGTPAQRQCPPLEPPRYGSISCTEGSEELSRCTISCDDSYGLSADSSRNRRCRCNNRNECTWRGSEAVCEYQADSLFCPIPDFVSAAYGVAEIRPDGALLRVNIIPVVSASQGWSVALMFLNSLPASVEIDSGNVLLRSVSGDRRIVTFNSMEDNMDISTREIYSFYVVLRNIAADADPGSYAAMASFYDEIIQDASCIQNISPVRPLPTTTTSVPSSTSPGATTQSTTRSTTTTRATTTTTQPTTTTTTTTQAPSTSSLNCEVLPSNAALDEEGFKILNTGWNDGGSWKFSLRADKFPDNKGLLANWVIKLEFEFPVTDIQPSVANKDGPYADGLVWLLYPKDYNDGVGNGEGRDKLQVFMLATTSGNSAPNAIFTFCRNGAIPSTEATGGNPDPTGGSPDTTTQPPVSISTSSITISTTTQSPGSSSRCESSSPYGNLPSFAQTIVEDINGADFYPQLTEFDYGEVLYLSNLFYEAQRSGRQPNENAIRWRGDSGLKDGCDVGHDLSGGWYDAGDNVKFGFPMAYSATTLAWGLLSFEDGYIASGEYDHARSNLKWVTNYLLKAHTNDTELYVQVGDPEDDHSQWLRPEDIEKVRVSYKIDANNPGSDVAAETAAAMAAASLVFYDDQAYSEELVAHAKQLFQFADQYRRVYHLSVPTAEQFYKSWSGYQDELLWAAVWLYKATDDQFYLNYVRNNYDNFGAGNTAQEYSWDNKFPGVQVLMAECTREQKYRNNVNSFMNYVESIPKTPMGMTWRIQWGPNRYAANYAFIALQAATIEPALDKRDMYIEFATKQINYLLGMNEMEASYVVGMGPGSPERPHHRSSSCPASSIPCGWNDFNRDGPNPHILYGALVGGPDINGVYEDSRGDYISNEVATDYNAGFQGALAGLQNLANLEMSLIFE